MSVAVRAGRIVEVTAGLMAPAHETLDAQGQLLSPPFIDAHFHMDATLSYGLPRVNASGTLLEGIAVWGELKPSLTQEALVQRAMAYCDWAVGKGLLAIRTHVDVCDPRLLAVDALLEVKRRVAPYIDMQLVAFPQDGVLRGKTGPQEHMDTLKRALDRGVDVVGGIPHFDRTMADGARKKPPTAMEIDAVQERRPITIRVRFLDDTFKSHHEAIDKLNHEIFLLQVHFSHFNSFPLALLPAVPSLSVVLGVQCQRA
jgi:cytosine deaminase